METLIGTINHFRLFSSSSFSFLPDFYFFFFRFLLLHLPFLCPRLSHSSAAAAVTQSEQWFLYESDKPAGPVRLAFVLGGPSKAQFYAPPPLSPRSSSFGLCMADNGHLSTRQPVGADFGLPFAASAALTDLNIADRDLSISVWVLVKVLAMPAGAEQTLLSVGASRNSLSLSLVSAATAGEAAIDWSDDAALSLASAPLLVLNKWVHVVLVRRSIAAHGADSSRSIYFNGLLLQLTRPPPTCR